MRAEILDAQVAFWERLAEPGTWLTGAQRVAVAAETRAARACALCQRRKQALSPYAVDGPHDASPAGTAALDEARIDAIHRVVTDPGRLSDRLVRELAAAGTDDAAWVEILAVVVKTICIDHFCRAIGMEPRPLPEPRPGAPRRERPSELDDIGAWVPVLSLRRPGARELWPGALRISNVARGLSLVPAEIPDQVALIEAHYLPLRLVSSTGSVPGRVLSRAQLELVASRVAALGQCFY